MSNRSRVGAGGAGGAAGASWPLPKPGAGSFPGPGATFCQLALFAIPTRCVRHFVPTNTSVILFNGVQCNPIDCNPHPMCAPKNNLYQNLCNAVQIYQCNDVLMQWYIVILTQYICSQVTLYQAVNCISLYRIAINTNQLKSNAWRDTNHISYREVMYSLEPNKLFFSTILNKSHAVQNKLDSTGRISTRKS